MRVDPNLIWIAVAVAAVLVVGLLVASGMRRRRTRELQDHFGPEYRHTVAATGSRTRAERELAAREARVNEFDIHPLSAADRERFAADWQRVETHFVSRPATAVVEADELIDEVMRTRGYPVGDFETRAKDLSVHYPRIVDNYRAAHRIIDAKDKSPSTEDLRQAMIRMRNLFEELVHTGDSEQAIRTDREIVDDRNERPLDRLRRDEERLASERDFDRDDRERRP